MSLGEFSNFRISWHYKRSVNDSARDSVFLYQLRYSSGHSTTRDHHTFIAIILVPLSKSRMTHFCESYHRGKDINFCDREHLGQGHGVQHSQLSHAMANINLYKSRSWAFSTNYHRFPHLKIRDLEKCRSRLWCTTFALVPFDGKYMTFYPMTIAMFALSLTIYEISAKQIKWKIWPWIWRSRSRGRKTRLAPFNWKCSNLCNWFSQKFSYLGTYVYTK